MQGEGGQGGVRILFDENDLVLAFHLDCVVDKSIRLVGVHFLGHVVHEGDQLVIVSQLAAHCRISTHQEAIIAIGTHLISLTRLGVESGDEVHFLGRHVARRVKERFNYVFRTMNCWKEAKNAPRKVRLGRDFRSDSS